MRTLLFSAAILIGAASLAVADDPKPSFKELIAGGYEIKDVTFVPIDAMKGMGYDDDAAPSVLVTLQKGASSAVCGYSASNWSYQTVASLEGTSQCDVYGK